MDAEIAHLPAPLAEVLDRAVKAVGRDPQAVGLIVNGSAGAGAADEYSDLDLVLVHADGTPDLKDRAHAFVGSIGEPLAEFTGEHVGEPNLVIALIDQPLCHVDVKCTHLADQARRVEDGFVAWQRDGAIARARVGTQARWPEPDPQWLEDRIWVWLHYAAAKAARGEFLECLDALSVLRSAVLGPLVAQERGVRPSGVRRLERIAADRLPQLHATLSGPERAACLQALVAVADLYRDVRPEGIVARDRAEDAVRRYVARLQESSPSRPRNGVE